uniref:Uncharacterized protein n=1 Tax=Sphaerodactylus townsendi TaxID=933632 RepID=A0ACB8ED93_9SAUR
MQNCSREWVTSQTVAIQCLRYWTLPELLRFPAFPEQKNPSYANFQGGKGDLPNLRCRTENVTAVFSAGGRGEIVVMCTDLTNRNNRNERSRTGGEGGVLGGEFLLKGQTGPETRKGTEAAEI